MADITYTCTPCGQTFSDEGSLKDHQTTDHSTKTEVTTEGEVK
ncbi:hypothetical protein BH09PAT1_BH09PAT1_6830 [soil metagenome]